MIRALRYLLVIGGAVVSILLFLLASASDNSAFFDQNYSWLLGLNALVSIALLGLVGLLLGRLYQRYKQGRFGSRLMTRLVLLFAVLGILPGTVIYVVSVQFVSRSIESWFDVRVESALEAGLNLGRAALDASLTELNDKARQVARELSDLSEQAQAKQLSRLRDQGQMQEATIFTPNGRVVATDGAQLSTLVPDIPTQAMLQQARLTRGFSSIEGGANSHDVRGKPSPTETKESAAAPEVSPSLRLRVLVAIPAGTGNLSLKSETRFLQLVQPVPSILATNAETLRSAFSEYQERKLARSGLRKIYLVTLTLTLLLAIFGALAGAFLIATDLAQPLLLLAQGTKAVAEGDFSPRPIIASSDELGTLTQSFNTMTRQLFDARASVENNRKQLENAKAYLESVLGNMSAGVMVLDTEFKLMTCNESVERILQHGFTEYIGKPLSSIEGLTTFTIAIVNAFSEQSAKAAGEGGETAQHMHWQHQIEIPRSLGESDADSDITLLARGSRLPIEHGIGYVIVFDNISDVMSAQRSIAWGEVARRLAHEIKNPLTPIQLSAERLQMRLKDKVSPEDALILNKSTATIVNQVAAMKRMVDDFRDYARTPQAILSPLNLNSLVEEILHLYMAGDSRDIIHPTLAPDLPQVMGDPTQLRQVIHNLLQNAQDAVTERKEDDYAPRIDVVTETVHYPSSDGGSRIAVRLSIADNGPGFASKILARAFEPYVTSKPRGTGLGLPMVKKIIDEHGGQIDIQNRFNANGAKILILLLKLAPQESPR